MRATLKDIALKTGFSANTVSRALRGDTRISKATSLRISEVANELNYVPNLLASKLRCQGLKIIGVLSADSSNHFFVEVISGIEEKAKELGYQILVANSEEMLSREEAIIKMFVSLQLDGIIAMPVFDNSNGHLNLYRRLPIPYVFSGRYLPGLESHSILHSDKKAMEEVFDLLLERGHKRILYISGPENVSNTADRLEGMRISHMKHGVALDEALVRHTIGHMEDGYAEVDHALNKGLCFTAVVCFNDLIAMGVMKSLAENDLDVPRDVEVFGFDNLAMSQFMRPSLSTVDVPKHLLGRKAVETLDRHIRNPQTPYAEELLATRLVLRESTEQRGVVR